MIRMRSGPTWVAHLAAVGCVAVALGITMSWLGWPLSGSIAGALALGLCVATFVAADEKASSRRAWIVVALLALIRVPLFFAFYDPATNWLHGDDYIRAWIAIKWSDAPFLFTPDHDWLPLQFYVYGASIPLLGGFLQPGMTAVSQLFAAATVIGVYFLAKRLFSIRAATFAAVLLTLTSWHVVASFSCLAEPLFHALIVWSMVALLRWRDEDRTRDLVLVCMLLMLAAATRYEGWIWLGLLSVAAAARMLPGRPRSRLFIIAVPWLVPVLWCAASWMNRGVVLSHYRVNRDWFETAMGSLSIVERVGVYPSALFTISPTVVLLCLATLAAWRRARTTSVLLLVTMAGLHFAVLVAMYAGGTGPQFVERVVLLHYSLLVAIPAAFIWELLSRAPRAGPVAAVGMILAFGSVHLADTRHVFESGAHSEHAAVRHAYAALGEHLRGLRPNLRGIVVVDAVDPDGIIGMIAGIPRRVRTVAESDEAPALEHGAVEVFCAPIDDPGGGFSGGVVEAAFLERHATSDYVLTTVSAWRVYTLAPRDKATKQRAVDRGAE